MWRKSTLQHFDLGAVISSLLKTPPLALPDSDSAGHVGCIDGRGRGRVFRSDGITTPRSKCSEVLFRWCMVCYDRTIFGWDITIWKSGIWGCKKNKNIEKIAFKVVQMKFLAMHITNQKLSFDIFTVGNLQNIFLEHDLHLMP